MLYLLLAPGGMYKGIIFFKGEDKMFHNIAFYLWSLSFYLSINWKSIGRSIFIILGLGTILAVGTELLQFYIPRRTPEVLDVLSDLTGCVFGILSGFLIKKGLQR